MVDKVNYRCVCRKCGEWYETRGPYTTLCVGCGDRYNSELDAKNKEITIEKIVTLLPKYGINTLNKILEVLHNDR